MKTVSKKSALLAMVASLALAGCVTPNAATSTGLYAKPIGDAPVTANPTPYSQALVCLADHARANGRIAPRIAVGRIVDYTGKVDSEGGRKITQGASLMAITAFAKSGARLVERFDTSVSELELKYANNKLISDGAASAGPATQADVRQIFAGQMPGSDFYLVGGVTEMNYNIRSTGVDAFVGDTDVRDPKGNLGAKLFVMNVGLDLRLVDTKTLEVVDVISYQKQVIGRELRAGVFAFWDDVLFDVGAGERALEPLQLAVRSSVERAVLEMMANVYGVESTAVCGEAIKAGGDPMGALSATTTGDFRTYRGTATAAIGDRRADPNAWVAGKDDGMAAVKPAEAVKAPAETRRPVQTTDVAPPARKAAAQPTPVKEAAAPRRPVRTTARTSTAIAAPATRPAAAPAAGLAGTF